MNKKKENDFLSEDELLEENSKNTEDNQNVDFVFKGTRSCFMLGPRTAEAAMWVWDMLAVPPWDQTDYIFVEEQYLDTVLGWILHDGLTFSRNLH